MDNQSWKKISPPHSPLSLSRVNEQEQANSRWWRKVPEVDLAQPHNMAEYDVNGFYGGCSINYNVHNHSLSVL